MPEPVRDVFVHVGPPKTGTSYLQAVLSRNRSELAAAGVTVPTGASHFFAALDLRDQPFNGYRDPRVPGSWPSLVEEALAARTDPVVISHEMFAGTDAEHVGRLVSDLAPATVHVIYGARDLARQLPAVWQETVKNRSRRSFPVFLDRILAQSEAGELETPGFWLGQHASTVLRRWETHVAPDRIHVVTLPQRGAAPNTLWQRFCRVLGIEPGDFDLDVGRANPSLSAEDTEVLRLVNAALAEQADWPTYQKQVKARFNRWADSGSTGTKLVTPPRFREVISASAAQLAADLAESGYDIVGDLEELIPRDEAFGPLPGLGSAVPEAAAVMLAELLLEAPASRGRRRNAVGAAKGKVTTVVPAARSSRSLLGRFRRP